MKKLLLSFVAIMLATVARAADGDTFTFEDLNYKVLSEADHTAEVTVNKRGLLGDINIPYFATGNNSRYIVTSIGSSAFRRCSLTSVTIPNSVTKIGNSAFDRCRSLTSMTIPNSVTEIGDSAFYGCTSLTSVTIPNSVTEISWATFAECTSLTSVTIPNSVTKIGSESFYRCTSLTSVIIPNSVTEIRYSAFSGCTSLTAVTIPNSVTEIGAGAFNGCSSLTSVSIPNSVTKIENFTFSGCSSLTSVTIPNSVTEIGWIAFSGCTSLTAVTIPSSVTKIDMSAFSQCSNLTSVTIPNSVTEIGESTFYGCNSLTSVTIPNSVTKIDTYTFYDCSSLTSVTIPKSVTGISEEAFAGCTSLTKIIDLNPTPQRLDDKVFEGVPADAKVYIPKGSFMDYMLSSGGWTHFNNFIEMGAFDITLSATTLELSKGESAELTVNIIKDDDVTVGDHEWTSSDTEVATVEDGKVTAIAPGTAVITYTVYDGYGVAHSESCTVTVAEPVVLVESITLDRTSIEAVEGSQVQLNATITPDNATNKEITWSSSDEAIATVSATGLVKILKVGNCVITAATTDGSNLKAECTVSALSGIDDILNDNSAMADVYTMQGVAVLRSATAADISALPAGIYIIRQGNVVKKIAVK